MANDYNVGNILINLEAKATQVDKALSSTITSLKQLKRTISGISNLNLDKVQNNFQSMSNLDLSNLSKSFEPLNNLNLKGFSSLTRQMKSISQLDMQSLYGKFSSLTRIIDPFIQKIQQAEPSLKAFSNAIDLGRVNAQLSVTETKINAINSKSNKREILDDKKIEKANVQLEITKKRLDKINEKSHKTSLSFSKIFNVGKMYLFYNYAKRWGRVLGNVVTEAINFEETLNKFQVSMGSNYEQSLKFVNSITKAFNISTESIMNYQSTFKNMLSALGSLSEDTSYQLSETLTRMALDYASLFNVSTERAMEQFQAVLSGQIRSIRSVSGYDVSETSIYGIYKSLGGNKTMRQLDQIEKRLLRIIAVQQQMEKTGAVGDFEKTINNTSNQIKQLKETFKELTMWVGQLTMYYIKPFVEKLLAVIIAIKEIVKYLNIINGYKFQDFGEGGLFGEIEQSATNTEKAIDSLKRNLLGFDTLNILGDTNTSSSSSEYDMLIAKIQQYSSSLDNVKNKANEISKSILEWLGYTYDVDGNLEKTGTRLDAILGVIGSIISLIIASSIGPKILNVLKSLKGIELISLKTMGIIGLIVSVVLGVVEGFKELYNVGGLFKRKVDDTLETIKEKLSIIWETLKKGFKELEPLWDIIKEIGAYIGLTILDIVEFILSLLTLDFKQALKSLKDILSNIGEIIIGVFEFLWEIIKKIGNVLWTILKPIIEWLWNGIKFIGEWIWNGLKKIGNFFVELWSGIKTGFANFVNWFIDGINTVIRLINRIKIDIPEIFGGGSIGFNIKELEHIGLENNVYDTPIASNFDLNPTSQGSVGNSMQDMFLDSTLPLAQAIVSGNQEVINAIEDLANRPVELNGRKVSENIYSDLQKVAMRKGQTSFSLAR